MNEPQFEGEVDEALVHGLHLLALAGGVPAVAPGYARADGRLRAALRMESPRLDAAAVPGFAALLAGEAPPPLDGPWFARRWAEAGEEATCAREADRLAVDAAAAPNGGLLAGCTVKVAVATSLRVGAWPRPVAPDAAFALRVAAGSTTPGALVVLAAIAARLPEDPRLAALSPEDAEQVRLHCAGSVLAVTLGDSAEIGRVLEAVTDVLLPPQHQGQRILDLIARFKRAGLFDQPPGEIERLGQGLARRYSDRLHRAWLRGFFVPRGGDVSVWARTLRGE